MSLSLIGTAFPIQMAFGQVIQDLTVVSSTASLTGETIKVYPALWIASPQNLAAQPMSGAYEVAYPAIDSITVDMVFQDAAGYENLGIELTRTSSTEFQLRFTFIAGRDSSAVSPSYINPTNLLDGKGVDFPSVYDGAKFLVLHIYSDSEYLRVDKPTKGEALRQFNDDQFTWVLKNAAGATVSTATCLQDLTIEFTAKYVGYSNHYQVTIHKRPPAGTDFIVQSIQNNLSLEGVHTLTGTLPELTSANLSASVLTNDGSSTPPTYTGVITIDGNYFLDPSVVSVIVSLFDLSSNYRSYHLEFTSFCKPVPEPVVETSMVIDNTLYDTNCAADIATGTEVQINTFIDPLLYNAAIQADGLPGNYLDNIREIRVYLLDYIPLENEDLPQPYVLAQTIPLAAGNATYLHRVGAAQDPLPGVIPPVTDYIDIVLVEYVFKDHSLRIPFIFMITDLADMTATFTDASNAAINQFCYDYANGIRLNLDSVDSQGFSVFDTYKFYRNDVRTEIVESVAAADDSGMDFILSPDNIVPGDCYDVILSTQPGEEPSFVAAAWLADITQNFTSAGPDYGLGFLFTLTKTGGGLPPVGRVYWIVTVRKGDNIIARSWANSPVTFVDIHIFFETETLALNTFTYTVYMFTEYGNSYFLEESLSTNNEPGTAGASVTVSTTVNPL